MTDTAILLVGGRGTRLGSLTDQTPKPLLEVAGRPFIFHLLEHLASQGIARVTLATGYLASQFYAVVGSRCCGLGVQYSNEDAPLGTGGAITHAFRQFESRRAFALNGDTLFKTDLPALEKVHEMREAAFSLVLRQVADVSRYGAIACLDDQVTAIHEKGPVGPGFINGGVYLIERSPLLAVAPAGAFSLENELLPKWVNEGIVAGIRSDAYFIDIGIPDDLARAQKDLARRPATVQPES